MTDTMPNQRQNQNMELTDEKATSKFAQSLANEIQAGDIVFLEGPLGAGKTFFSQAFVQHLGYTGKVLSPTYSLVQSYAIQLKEHSSNEPVKLQLHHFDLYRLSDPEELEYIGIRDYINQHDICLIEWPSKGGALLPDPSVRITLDYHPQDTLKRSIQVAFN